jgi:signal peptidase II
MTDTARPNPNALIWLLLSTVLIALDQWTKLVAVEHLVYSEPVTFIAGFWNWTLAHNTGAAFSVLATAGGWQHVFFIGLATIISIVLAVWLARTPRGAWRSALPFALVIAGALGNVVDRLRFGYVVDFIDWHVGQHHWPIFNIADSCIVVGAAILVLSSFAKEKTP